MGAFMRDKITKYLRQAIAGTCLLTLALSPLAGYSQVPQPVPVPDTGQPIPVPDTGQPIPVPAATTQQAPALSPNQLEGLVAPIALYPDQLISQVLVAATYPLEVVEAYQWLQQNPGLTGPALTQAAATQNWDPSVQALVVFPDVLKRLNEDISWTTSLGNAFLNQQADVMGAIQRMRASAEQSGKLVTTPQQQVINATQDGQPVVEILPANPEVIYVPTYDPYWVWGPPVYYPYASWYYPPYYRTGLFFGAGIGFGAFFGAGWGGWGGWGWHPAWGGRSVIVNNLFINRYHFNTVRTANFARESVWAHDAIHRQGVPYPNRALSERFGNVRQSAMPARAAGAAAGRSFAAPSRAATPMASSARSFASRPMASSVPNRNAFAASPARSYAAPQARSYAPQARSYEPQSRSYAPQARSYEPQARSYAPQARSFAPQSRSYAPQTRSFAPQTRSTPSYGGGSSSRGGGASVSHGGGGGSHGGGGGRARR
jgi:uncharacterized membrane protein YgcG